MGDGDALWPIGMPNLGHTMESGKVVAWQKRVGDSVARGEVLCVVESDKVSVEIESPADGTLIEIRVGDNGVAPQAAAPAAPPDSRAAAQAAEPAKPAERPAPAAPRYVRRASPVAERLAAELGVDLAPLSGTGPDGLITKQDVQLAAAARQTVGAPAPVTEPLSDVVRLVIDLDIEMLAWRRRIDEVTIPMSVFAARALSLALTVRPQLGRLRHAAYGLCAALALGQRGQPQRVVVRDIEHKALPTLGDELLQLERRARSGSLEPWRTEKVAIAIDDFSPYGIDVVAAAPVHGALTLALGRPRRIMAETRDGFGVRTTMAVSLAASAQLLSPHEAADLLEAVALNLADPDALYTRPHM